MASPWQDIREGLRQLVADISGRQTVWMDQAQPFYDPDSQTTVFLQIRNRRRIGQDERRTTDTGAVAPTAPLVESVVGNRQLRLEVRVESLDHHDSSFAFHTAEDIAVCLNSSNSLARLREFSCSLSGVEQIQDLTTAAVHDRAVSVAQFEAVINAVVCYSDEGRFPIQIIETVDPPIDNPGTEITT